MNYPSVKTLLCISGLTSQEAKRIRRVMRSQDRDEICSLSPKADKWRRQCQANQNQDAIDLLLVSVSVSRGHSMEWPS